MGSLAYAQSVEEPHEVDRELVVRSREGDHDAFADIVRSYQRRVYGVALRMTRRHEVADDVAQETFIRAYRNLDRFELGRPLGPWLVRIAVNLAINHLNGVAKREQSLYTEDSPEGPAHLQEGFDEEQSEPEPLRKLLRSEFLGAFDKAFAKLSPDHQAVLVLKVQEGMRYEEIGEALGVSLGTVMSRLHRARAKLKAMLEDHL